MNKKSNELNISSYIERILHVFKFTIMQSFKNKAFIGMLVFTAIGVMGYVYYMAYTNSETAKETETHYVTTLEETSIEGVEIIDDNALIQNILQLSNSPTKVEAFNNINMSVLDEDIDNYKDTFNKDEEKNNTLLIHISNSNNGYDMNVYTQEETDIVDEEIYILTTMLENVYKTGKLSSIGMDESRMAVANTAVVSEVVTVEEEENDDMDYLAGMMLTLLFTMVIYMIIQYCGNNISSQIVTEKSTKLVEFLLVTLKPLELVGGKILAGVAISIIQTFVMGVSAVAGAFICKEMGLVSSYSEIISVVSLDGMSLNINVLSIVLIVIVIAIGFLFYGTLSGICASTVSKLEELASANSLYSMITMIGYISAIVIGVSDVEVNVLKVLSVIPITSVFILPTSILLGKLTNTWVIIAIIIQLVIIALFIKLAAIIYENLILHYGDKVKFKDILLIFKDYMSKHLSSKKSKVGGVNE